MNVSVIVPCFNAAAFVEDALRSVSAQTHRNFECLVVDDASTDETRDIVARWALRDSRVRLVALTENGGPAAARNRALDLAAGDWVTFLDADDLFEADRLERLLAAAAETGADIVVDNQSVRTYPDGPHLFRAFSFLPRTGMVPITADLFFQEDARLGRHLKAGYMKPMIRRVRLDSAGVRFDTRFRVGEDGLFYGELFALGLRGTGIAHQGYIYRRRPVSASRSRAVDLLKVASISEVVLERHGARLSRAAKQALQRRARNLRRSAVLGEIRASLADGKTGEAVAMAVRRPDALLHATSLLRRRVLNMAYGLSIRAGGWNRAARQ